MYVPRINKHRQGYRHRQIHRHCHRYSHNCFYSFFQKYLTLFSKYQLNVLRFVSLSCCLQLGDRNSAPIPDHCTATAGVGGRSIFLRFWGIVLIFLITLCTQSAAKTLSTILPPFTHSRTEIQLAVTQYMISPSVARGVINKHPKACPMIHHDRRDRGVYYILEDVH